MRWLIYSEECGIYLGNCMGLGFWSKLDPVGQNAACTFSSLKDAADHVFSWEGGPPKDWVVTGVYVKDPPYATIEECKAMGLPGWDPMAAAADRVSN